MVVPVMLRAAFWRCIAALLAGQHIRVIQAAQVPLGFDRSDWQPNPFPDDTLVNWGLNELPFPNATHHLVFETVSSLLQHWPNTRLRNGK
jgi:hypothetical protein